VVHYVRYSHFFNDPDQEVGEGYVAVHLQVYTNTGYVERTHAQGLQVQGPHRCPPVFWPSLR
jgi:hypothetical protein